MAETNGATVLGAAAPAAEDRRWYALYTAPNHEKRVEQQLRMKGVEPFLPLVTVTKRWKNRTTVKVELPLFTGYVFARIGIGERARVLEIPSVLWIVGNAQGPASLPEAEIEALRSGLHLRQVDPYPYLKTGNRARISAGAFAGLVGIVVRRDEQLRIVLSLDLIQCSIAVHVTADEVEPCEDQHADGDSSSRRLAP